MKDKKLRQALDHHLDLINEYLDKLIERGKTYENLLDLIEQNLGKAASVGSIQAEGKPIKKVNPDEVAQKTRAVGFPIPDSARTQANISKLVGLNPQPSYVSTEDLVRLRDLIEKLKDSLNA